MVNPSGSLAAADGQLLRELRSRNLSGFLTHLASLSSLIDDIGAPCLASGLTAAALHGIDGFRLAPPFDVIVPRGRNVARAGHRVHTLTNSS